MKRRWLPTFAELIDRLSIHQLKEVFVPEHKEKYAMEMRDIMYDLDAIIGEKNIIASGDMIRAIIVLAQINAHIWYNESSARKGTTGSSLLELTHGLNGIRSQTMNFVLNLIGDTGRQDWKTDCLAAEFKDWEISLG